VDTKSERKVRSFRRAIDWKHSHNGIVQTAPAPVQGQFISLDEVIARIETTAVMHVSQHQRATRDATNADANRKAVRAAMRPITQVARSLHETVYGISSISRMPKFRRDNERLVTEASSMAENATIYKDVLIAHGLQPDCIETLRTAAAALKSSIDARGAAKAMAVGARKGIRADIAEGSKLVSRIDAGLARLLEKDPASLASWQNAKRITIKGVSGTIAPSAQDVTAPSATPPATAAEGSTRGA